MISRYLNIVAVASLLCVSVPLVSAGARGWMEVPENRVRSDEKYPRVAKEYTVNLDLPQEERWAAIGEEYKDVAWMLVNYLRVNLPPGWLKPLEKVAGHLLPFFKDYGDEMKGYAKALGITEGDVVMINLIYQLEHLGLSCDSWNTTGPVNEDFCERNDDFNGIGNLQLKDNEDIEGPGPCTSFVASNPDGTIYHGRNLDWNLADSLKQFLINVKYQRGGKTVFHGTTAVGFVGILHAVKENAFGWSMDARRKGGNIPLNILEMALSNGTRTPEQHARYVFENYQTYDEAVEAMGSWPIVNPVYYIISGTKYPEGSVLARSRERVVHHYKMEEVITSPGGNTQMDFWVGVTNYDLEFPPIPADDRATPMTDNLNALAGKDFDDSDIWDILKTWPTFNMHTDISAVMDVKKGSYDVIVWFDHHLPTPPQ